MESRAIVKRVFAIFSEVRVASIFRYGNKSGRDVDIFVLLRGATPYIKVDKGIYDFTVIGLGWREILIKYRDPLIIEPVFSGEELYG